MGISLKFRYYNGPLNLEKHPNHFPEFMSAILISSHSDSQNHELEGLLHRASDFEKKIIFCKLDEDLYFACAFVNKI